MSYNTYMLLKSMFSLSFGLLAVITSSTGFKLNSYSLDGGSTNSSASTTYKLNSSSGATQGSTTASTNYQTKSGVIQSQQANVPNAPTLSNNGGAYFDKLNFIIDTSGNPTDATYSVAVSTTSNFTVTDYVQSDGTLNTTPVYQTYTAWGSGAGTLALGLSSSTAYWFKVDAIHGRFSASGYGPSATVSTGGGGGGPTLSYSLTPNTINLGSLTSGSVITSSTISFTYSTNASNGGTIYMAGSTTGLTSTAGSYTIGVSPPSGNLTSLGEGFGLQGLTASAPLTIQSPYNGSSNTVGAVYTSFQPVFAATSAVTTGTATAVLLAKASVTTPSASDYTNTLTFVAAASF